MESNLKVGDSVICHLPGSFVDGKWGRVYTLDAEGSDGVRGIGLKMEKGYTIVDADCVEKEDAKQK